MADHRSYEFHDASAHIGALHDEARQDEEWQRKEDESARAALGVHHDRQHVGRADRLHAHDADGGEHKADWNADSNRPHEQRCKQGVEQLRMRAEIGLENEERQHRGPHDTGCRRDCRPSPLGERKTGTHDEQGGADGDRQSHPDVSDAEQDRLFLGVGDQQGN